MATERTEERFVCHDCRMVGVTVDEDGCCKVCGSDTTVVLCNVAISEIVVPAAPAQADAPTHVYRNLDGAGPCEHCGCPPGATCHECYQPIPAVPPSASPAEAEPEKDRAAAVNQFRMDELTAVMFAVDKWLAHLPENDERRTNNPATRAADAREIALQAIEKERAALSALRGQIDDFRAEIEVADQSDLAWLQKLFTRKFPSPTAEREG